MKIVIVGAGKVGTALARALGKTSHRSTLCRARRELPRLRADLDLVVLAVRDSALPDLVRRIARAGWIPPRSAVVHVAGALGPEVLAPLRAVSAGVAQAHPLLAFASARRSPDFSGAHLLVSGDRVAVRRASVLGRAIGMRPRAWRIDPGRYHAAAALTANGAMGLLAAAAELLETAGIGRREAVGALAPLLRSAAENAVALGLPAALTGPIRRGDAAAVRRHLAAISMYLPEIKELYSATGRAQLSLARELGVRTGAVEKELGRGRPAPRKLRRERNPVTLQPTKNSGKKTR
jgi:predicted short-subunit dehydrogenase-like oxidoreductase (DUF2520 family)